MSERDTCRKLASRRRVSLFVPPRPPPISRRVLLKRTLFLGGHVRLSAALSPSFCSSRNSTASNVLLYETLGVRFLTDAVFLFCSGMFSSRQGWLDRREELLLLLLLIAKKKKIVLYSF